MATAMPRLSSFRKSYSMPRSQSIIFHGGISRPSSFTRQPNSSFNLHDRFPGENLGVTFNETIGSVNDINGSFRQLRRGVQTQSMFSLTSSIFGDVVDERFEAIKELQKMLSDQIREFVKAHDTAKARQGRSVNSTRDTQAKQVGEEEDDFDEYELIQEADQQRRQLMTTIWRFVDEVHGVFPMEDADHVAGRAFVAAYFAKHASKISTRPILDNALKNDDNFHIEYPTRDDIVFISSQQRTKLFERQPDRLLTIEQSMESIVICEEDESFIPPTTLPTSPASPSRSTPQVIPDNGPSNKQKSKQKNRCLIEKRCL